MLKRQQQTSLPLKDRIVGDGFSTFSDAAEAVEEGLEDTGLACTDGEPDVFAAFKYNGQLDDQGNKMIVAIAYIGYTDQEILTDIVKPWK